MMSRIELAALVASAVIATGGVWVPAVSSIRRLLRRRGRAVETEPTSLFDVIRRSGSG